MSEPSAKRVKTIDLQTDDPTVGAKVEDDTPTPAVAAKTEDTTGLRRSLRSRTKGNDAAAARPGSESVDMLDLSLPKKKTTATTANKKRKSVVWTVDHLLHSKRSKLVNANFSSLINPQSWALLDEEERKKLLKLLPESDVDLAMANINAADTDMETLDVMEESFVAGLFSVLNNDAFKTSVSDLQDDLANGYWEKGFIKEAQKAATLRVGKNAKTIDNFKDNQFERWWGQKQAVGSIAGSSAAVSFLSLCQKRVFRVGDEFQYRRSFTNGVPTVEKDLTLTDIDLCGASSSSSSPSAAAEGKQDTCNLTFRMPPGTSRYSNESTPDKEITVSSLQKLELLILDEDGRPKEALGDKLRMNNAWKNFKIYRNNELLGSTFEIRQRSLQS